MAKFDVLRCSGVNVNFAYFSVLDILDALDIQKLVLANKRVSGLIKQHTIKHPIVHVAMRQVALLELTDVLDGMFSPFDAAFQLEAMHVNSYEHHYDAEERFLWLCWSLASGKSVKSLRYLHKEVGTKEIRMTASSDRSLYRYFRQMLNDNTRQLIIDYREGKLEPLGEEEHARLDKEANEGKVEAKASLGKVRAAKVVASSFDAEIRVAVQLMEEAELLLLDQVASLQRGNRLSLNELRVFCQKLCLSHERNPNAILAIRHVRNVDSYLAQHAFGCAVLACHLAKALKLSEVYVETITLGALLFDIGRFKLPTPMMVKHGKLSDAELDLMRKHITFGERMLALYIDLPKLAVQMLKDHHERLDGTGYPNAKIDEEISVYGKIAAIVDAYDSMTSSQAHKSSMGPVDAWHLMQKEAGLAFDADVLKVFLRSIGKSPVGTCVELSNGRAGYVLTLNGKQQPSIVRQVYSLTSDSFILPVDVKVDLDDEIAIVNVLEQDKFGSNFIDHIVL